MQNIISTMPFR